MTSMIDVVFLLLVFFLVTTSFNRPEHRLRSAITADSAADAGSGDLEPAIIDIVADGESFQYRIGDVRSADLEPIRQVLQTFRNKETGAYVRVIDAAPFDWPARAIAACKQSGFELISYVPLR